MEMDILPEPPENAPSSVPSRVRRGNAEDHQRLQAAIVAAAFELFQQGGADAITMQALAERLGRSAMSLYRYFDSKNTLLLEIWRVAYAELLLEMRKRVAQHRAPQERHRALLESFLDFWEARPDYYELVYKTSAPGVPVDQKLPEVLMPAYGDIIALSTRVTKELADELGKGHERITVATEMRLAFLLGYLQARFANQRYPWHDFVALRKACVDATLNSVVQCLAGDDSAKVSGQLEAA